MGSAVRTKTINRQSTGARREWWGTIRPSSLYAAGGDDVNVQTITEGSIREAELVNLNVLSHSGTYYGYIKFSEEGPVKTFKLFVVVAATGAEAGAIDLSAERFRCQIRGV